MLLTLLLDAAPTSPTAIAALAVSAVGLLFAILSLVRKEQREDGQTISQRLKKLESTVADHDKRHEGQVQARERLAEHLDTQLGQLSRDTERRCQALEEQLKQVPQLERQVIEMRADLKRLEKIETKLDRLTEILTGKIA